ncbi:hypothetical protein FZEAL_9261 [Fusarium zealandicum]|uniref:Tip elongation aberrant protein 3 n=1 Tax=Fusarium zealandicum TaxID=1053134 RepID=A0A8H4XGX7_9HYPO|nr:hypothetical protein FZEAL_9261 [Fusarium zealandicum]
MAEVAAGAIAAEQIISTTIEAGAAAAVAQPTQPLNAVLSQIATTPTNDDSLALARSHHSITVIGSRGYIFGGKKEDGSLCKNDVHAISLSDEESGGSEYACFPAVGENGEIPPPRLDHSACPRGETLIIFGGQDGSGQASDEESCLWEWEPKSARWAKIEPVGKAPGPRSGHQIFLDAKKDTLILHGGLENGQPTTETWSFDFTTRIWSELPPAPATSLAAQLVDGTLYFISGDSDMHGSIHFLTPAFGEDDSAETPEWSSIDFPTNPLVSGPRPRVGSALAHVTTGLGRRYLVYLLGSRQDANVSSSNEAYNNDHPYYSDMWSLQLPSDGFSVARVKDAIRDALPSIESGAFSWHELDIAPSELKQTTGKLHPGPRGFFGADTCLGGKGVILWGGVNAKGETEADGWLLQLS